MLQLVPKKVHSLMVVNVCCNIVISGWGILSFKMQQLVEMSMRLSYLVYVHIS